MDPTQTRTNNNTDLVVVPSRNMHIKSICVPTFVMLGVLDLYGSISFNKEFSYQLGINDPIR